MTHTNEKRGEVVRFEGLRTTRWEGMPSAILVVVLLLQGAYALAGILYPNSLFGINQLHWLPQLAIPASLAAVWIVSFLLSRSANADPGFQRGHRRFSGLDFAILAGTSSVAGAVFLALRNRFVNRDGLAALQMIPREVPIRGAFLSPDQLLDTYLHSRVWYFTNQHLGWDVRQSYHALAAIAGAIFILVLVWFVIKRPLLRPSLFLVLFLSGGAMQLFFGDIEHYTMVTAVLMGYVVSDETFLRGKTALVVPSFLVVLAMDFHLVAAWFLPSTAYLYFCALRQRRYGQAVMAMVVSAAVLLAPYLYFNSHGLPLGQLFSSSHAFALVRGEHAEYLNFVQADVRYYADLANLLMLLYPAGVIVPVLLWLRKMERHPFNVFLVTCILSAVLFAAVWNAQLGVYQDWNLFAPLAIPLAFFVSWNVGRSTLTRTEGWLLMAFGLTCCLHSYAWILSNHFMQNY